MRFLGLNIYLAGCCWFSTIPVYTVGLLVLATSLVWLAVLWLLLYVWWTGWGSMGPHSSGITSCGWRHHFTSWWLTTIFQRSHQNWDAISLDIICRLPDYTHGNGNSRHIPEKKVTKYLFFPDTFPIKQVIFPLFTENLPGVNTLYYEYIDLLARLSKILWFLWSTKALERCSR